MEVWLWLLLLCGGVALTTTQTTRYVYDVTRVRTTPAMANIYPTGAPWVGPPAPIPHVPGDRDFFDTIPIQATPGGACRSYNNQNRGHYFDVSANRALRIYYPFKDWVNNCDVRLFLWCQGGGGPGGGQCRCFQGMHWDEAAGICVAGYEQNCTDFVGYDFRKRRDCGEGMECDAGACVCYKNTANIIYRGPNEVDGFGNPKWFCGPPVRVNFGENCSEFMARKWERNAAPVPGGPLWTMVNTTKTGCADLEGSLWANVKCRFPREQTGPNPTPFYGARVGGKCLCTDLDQLRFEPGVGCRPKLGAVCDPETGAVSYIAKDPNTNALVRVNATNGCGADSVCVADEISPGDDDSNPVPAPGPPTSGMCACAEGAGRDANGFCNATIDTSDVGIGQLVGNQCHPIDQPCHRSGGQACVNGACQCRRGFQLVEEEKLCKGLYGQNCPDVSFCLGGVSGGFECVLVPELQSINPNIDTTRKFCVCKDEYLHIETGRCGGYGLKASQGMLLLVGLLILGGNFF